MIHNQHTHNKYNMSLYKMFMLNFNKEINNLRLGDILILWKYYIIFKIILIIFYI